MVEKLGQGVPIGFSGCNLGECDGVRLTMLRDKVIQHGDDVGTWQQEVDIDGERLSFAVVQHVNQSVGSAAVERVVHEVHCPRDV